MRSRVTTALQFLVVCVLAVELAVWEAFLTAARPFGTPLPLAAALAVVGNLAVCTAGARVLGRQVGAVVPALLWLSVALLFGSSRPEGDTVVPNTWRGISYLVAGGASAAAAVALAGARRPAPPQPGASPQP